MAPQAQQLRVHIIHQSEKEAVARQTVCVLPAMQCRIMPGKCTIGIVLSVAADDLCNQLKRKRGMHAITMAVT